MKSFTGSRILLVEASRLFSAVLSYRFEAELGLRVTHCASYEALSHVLFEESEPFEMAVVDLNLPGSPNGEVLDTIAANGIATVVFTASFSMAMRQGVLDHKIVDYVIKDNDLAVDNVVATVKRAFSNRDKRVLIVDDSQSARASLVDLLHTQQFTTAQAATGVEALTVLEQFSDIQLVITDYHMPDMDGYELTRKIRRRYSSDRLRIIGISSSTDRLLSASFLKAGASDFVYRPFVEEELNCRISHNIEILSQLSQLRAAAYSDHLTGLSNRRCFFDQGPKLVESCLLDDRDICAAILDIDHFKRLNDTYGHKIGDSVLTAVAACLRSEVENGEHLLCRLGGEEFGFLLCGLSSREATTFCDEIRRKISELVISIDGRDIKVTVSLGVAQVDGRESFENYLNVADQFLYMAKNNGRNQVYSDHYMLHSSHMPAVMKARG